MSAAILGLLLFGTPIVLADEVIGVASLLKEMVDFENLAERPQPFFIGATASSYSRESHKGGEAWFDNSDVGQYVRTETNDGRKEHVLADLKGPGTLTRIWSANPTSRALARFYFDGQTQPRIEVPFSRLFHGKMPPFGPAFSYVSGTGGNLYFPLPYAGSLKITIEEKDEPVHLYYEIGYRTYPVGTLVETFDPSQAASWADVQAQVGLALSSPKPAPAPDESQWLTHRLTVRPGQTQDVPEILGEKAVYEWSAQVLDTRENLEWADPLRAHNAYRFLLLDIRFDGERSVLTPLGDFFGSAPGINPYENMFFTVDENGKMTSRLLMPFKKSMRMSLTNAGKTPYTVEVKLHVGQRAFTDRSYHLRAQWGSLSRDTWPFFDMSFLKTAGEGKVIGTVYEIANPVLIWWGEGDQKISIDGEAFPSTFGTGTEDDYGYAYGHNGPFARPYHAQTRVDGPASGGHISLNRWYVLDALPYRTGIQFDQEVWHWMPCKPTWAHVIYWYAQPGTAGPLEIDSKMLAPPDLGIRANMLDPLEGEDLQHEETGGTAERQRLANCSRAEHLVWQGAQPGDRLTIHFAAPKAGRYTVELNLCMSPDYGRQKLYINGKAVRQIIDGYSPKLYWQHAKLGVFDLKGGDNTLVAEVLKPNSKAKPGNLFGLDYIFLVRQTSILQESNIRRISLEGKEGVPAPVAEPGKDGIDRIHKVQTPALELFPTMQKPARGTIMVCPGGGYSILAINHEGYFVAKKLNEFGYDVAILLYRVNAGDQTRELAIADAKAALALLQKRGGEFGLGTNKIGVMGFSAGGHLAARLTRATATDSPPDFAILMYPAYLEQDGKIPDEVAPVKTPAFVYVAGDDPYAPSATAYAEACQAANVPCDFTKTQRGGHGFGLKPVLPPDVKDWPDKLRGFLDGLE